MEPTKFMGLGRVFLTMVLLLVGNPVQAASAPPVTLDAIKMVLADAIQTKMKIDSTTTPDSRYFYRAYVDERSTDEVKKLVSHLTTQVKTVLTGVSGFLVSHRKGRLPPDETTSLQNIVSVFNSFIIQAARTDLVFEGDHVLGRYAPSQNIFDGLHYEIDVTVFDFTTGFAKDCRTSQRSGILAYRESNSGEIRWETSGNRAVAIVGIEHDGTPQVERLDSGGISSAYDPVEKRWVVDRGDRKRPTASIYDPTQRKVVSRSEGRHTGIGAVYNPATEKIEWASGYMKAIAGYFDENENRVKWVEQEHGGVACVTRSKSGEFTFSNSYYGGEPD